jgi:hypothetical protein
VRSSGKLLQLIIHHTLRQSTLRVRPYTQGAQGLPVGILHKAKIGGINLSVSIEAAEVIIDSRRVEK